MDPQTFLRQLDSRLPAVLRNNLSKLNGLLSLNGLNPLATINSISLDLPPPDTRGYSKLAHEEAKIVQIITSSQGDTLKPNSRKSVTVGDTHVCVAYRDDSNIGYRILEWHGHILMWGDEKGYTPRNTSMATSSSPLNEKKEDKDEGLGLSGIINGNNKKQGLIVHSRNTKKDDSASKLVRL